MRRAAVLALLLLAGCDQMRVQPRDDADGPAALFADGKTDQAPPDGVIAQEDPALTAAAVTRPPMSAALIERGRQRYAIACMQCHDAAGYGAGVAVARGFPKPESFHTARLRGMTAEHVVQVIADGQGTMFPQADKVAPADRWAIAAYIQALQLSQATPAALLSADEQGRAARGG